MDNMEDIQLLQLDSIQNIIDDLQALKSLNGLETKIGVEFSCSDCKNLTSLDCPNASIDDDFICHNCTMLFSLKGMPKYIGRSFSIKGCFNISDLTPLKTANIKKKIYMTQMVIAYI